MAKITKKEMYNEIMGLMENMECEHKGEILEFLSHEIEMLNHRYEKSSSTLTKTQKENVSIMENIKSALFEVAKPVTISELIAAAPELAGLSNQKISALLKLMREKGVVKRSEIKSKAYFELA